MCHFLPKQESRLLYACYDVPAGPVGTLRYFLDSRLCGNEQMTQVSPHT